MKKMLFIATVLVAVACSQQKKASAPSSEKASYGDDRIGAIEMINDQTFKLTEQAGDKIYGYTKENPVKVGGVREGPTNERRFLNALLGSQNETVQYERSGSCCPFKTPNGLFENTGMLDAYRVWWEGGKDTVIIYINMYDKGNLRIPVGFNAK